MVSRLWCFLNMVVKNMTSVLLAALSLSVCIHTSQGQSYSDAVSVFRDRLGNNSDYTPEVRPLLNQSEIINVNVSFSILAIAEMDDINQRFVVNGYISMAWKDEIAAWDHTQYNGLSLIHPLPTQLWRPRVVLFNTLDDRDLFQDDYSPFQLFYDGTAQWYPGSLFPVSCKLNMEKFPFDRQYCSIVLVSLIYSFELSFTPVLPVADLSNYTQSGSWDLEATEFTTGSIYNLALFETKFTLKRRPGFFIMNIVMPIVALSLLNILVFLIPVDSGEKISYGITVLLALAVFLSIVSGMLPATSDHTPLVTIYIFVLLIISVCTVIDSIFIVWLHHRDEKETKRRKAAKSFQGAAKKLGILKRAIVPMPSRAAVVDEVSDVTVSEEPSIADSGKTTLFTCVDKMKRLQTITNGTNMESNKKEEKEYVNKYRLISKHIDMLSFVAFMALWFSVTLGFIAELAS